MFKRAGGSVFHTPFNPRRANKVRVRFWTLIFLVSVFSALAFASDNVRAQATGEIGAQTLIGEWTGSLEIGLTTLPIRVTIDVADPIDGQFFFVGKSEGGVPLADVSLNGQELSFSVPAQPPLRFTGHLETRTIQGIVAVSHSNGKFMLSKTEK